MSRFMKGCWDARSSRNVPVRASWHLMSPASQCTSLTLTQLRLCSLWWQGHLPQQGFRNLCGRITSPTLPCSWSQGQGMRCTTLLAWSLLHKRAESDPDIRDARGDQALIVQKLVSETGINGKD